MVQYGTIITTRAKQALKATEQGKWILSLDKTEKRPHKKSNFTLPLIRVTLKCLKGKKL